jgi:hypothetical protein
VAGPNGANPERAMNLLAKIAGPAVKSKSRGKRNTRFNSKWWL